MATYIPFKDIRDQAKNFGYIVIDGFTYPTLFKFEQECYKIRSSYNLPLIERVFYTSVNSKEDLDRVESALIDVYNTNGQEWFSHNLSVYPHYLDKGFHYFSRPTVQEKQDMDNLVKRLTGPHTRAFQVIPHENGFRFKKGGKIIGESFDRKSTTLAVYNEKYRALLNK